MCFTTASSTLSIFKPVFALISHASSQGMPIISSISFFVSSTRALGRSILFITGTISKFASSARYTFASVCAWTPWLASTTNKAPSQASKDLLTSYEKSTCPGVSIKFSVYSSPLYVYFMVAGVSFIVIPRSRSISILSSNWSSISRFSTAPVYSINLSASVLFPWSICATMQKFLILSILSIINYFNTKNIYCQN